MNLVRAKDVEGWNMSVSSLFGKSPKMNIKCGKCSIWFSKRFDLHEFPNPITKCPHCRTANEVPIKYD